MKPFNKLVSSKFFSVLSFLIGFAGMSAVGQPEGFPDVMPLMDSSLIKARNITQAHAEISVKYDNQPIRSSRRSMALWFNTKGQAYRVAYINEWAQRTDIIMEQQAFDAGGRCTLIVTSGFPQTTVELFRYENDRLISRKQFQVDVTVDWKKNLDKIHLTWADSLATDNEFVVWYNQYHKPFRKEREECPDNELNCVTLTYDQGGKLIKRTSKQLNDQGRLTELAEMNLNQHLFNWRKEFFYDAEGRLSEERYFREGKAHHVRRISYLPNGLPELDLTRINETGRMIIAKFTYR